MNKYLILLLLIIFAIIPFSYSETWKYNYLDERAINYSNIVVNLSVNDTEYFQGYTPTTLWDYYTGLGNALWCQLTGCTMQGDIDMDGNDILSAGTLTAGATSVTSLFTDGYVNIDTRTKGTDAYLNFNADENKDLGLTFKENDVLFGGFLFDTSANDMIFANYVNSPSADIYFYTRNALKMVLTGNGNVGITTNGGIANYPTNFNANADDLVIAGTGARGITIASTDSNTANLFFSDGVTGAQQYAGWLQYTHATDKLDIATNAVVAMTIDNAQQVGINNNLTVNGDSLLSNSSPIASLTYSLGSGALRWLNLFVQNINAEEVETINAHILNNLTVSGNITGNQIYGGMWYTNYTPTNLNFAVDGTFYQLFMQNATNLNGFGVEGLGHIGSASNLTTQIGGVYQANYMATGDGQNNHEYHTSIFINGVNQMNCDTQHKMTAGGDVLTQTGTCLINLEVGDKISLKTADIGSTGTGNYYGANLDLVRVGS